MLHFYNRLNRFIILRFFHQMLMQEEANASNILQLLCQRVEKKRSKRVVLFML